MAGCAPFAVLQLQELEVGFPLITHNLWRTRYMR